MPRVNRIALRKNSGASLDDLLLRNGITFLCLSLLSGPVLAQNNCDSIVIDLIQFNAIDPGIINVQAYVTNFDCISYPSFILYDSNGDTLAAEVTDFFCLGLGSAQTHRLEIRPGVELNSATFFGTLELFSWFGDSLVCSWNFPYLTLCPQETCTEAMIYLVNGSDPIPFTAYWWVSDESGTWIETGTFEVDTLQSAYLDTVCLPPGNYTLDFSPFSPIQPGYVIGISTNYPLTIGTNTTLQNDSTPLDLNFSWYNTCADDANAIPELDLGSFNVLQGPGRLEFFTNDEQAIGSMHLFTTDGRVARSLSANSDRVIVPTTDLQSGIYIVRIVRPKGLTSSQRIFIP